MNTDLILVTKTEAELIAKIDSRNKKLTSDPARYVKENTFAYYVLINTWLHLIRECDRYLAAFVSTYLKKYGLVPFIKECDETALRLVKGLEVEKGLLSYRIKEAAFINPVHESVNLDPERNFKRDALATALQLLRYPKRFSPRCNDVIQTESLKEFVDVENRNKLLQRRERPRFLVESCKEIIADLLPWDEICDEIESLPREDFKFSSGTTAEGLRTLGEKVTFMAANYPECFVAPMGIPYIFPYLNNDDRWDVKQNLPHNVSVVQAVPKSYKAARIIAMEGVYRQSKSARVLDIILDHLKCPWIDIRHQDRNQELAWEGSVGMSIATLDATHASDFITKSMWRELFPSRFVALVDPLLGNYTKVGDRIAPMQMASTSGHELTFIIETIVYFAIGKSACIYADIFDADVSRFTNHGLDGLEPICSVYGDDTALWTGAAQTAIEFFEMMGLKINVSKSFIDGRYRESCGEEYLDGCNLTTVYFPRFPLIGSFSKDGKISLGVRLFKDTYRGKTDDSTTMLVDLQKRLFRVSTGASCFVEDIIRQVRPKMTSSPAGSDLPDMWSYTSLAPEVTPTGYTIRGERVPLSPELVELCTTERHSYVSIRYTFDELKLTESMRRAYDTYKYQRFLLSGPSYSDPLLRLLGISDKPLSYDAAFGKGTLEWRSIVI
jgi:hypothetical protein